MQMLHGLTAFLARVRHDAEALLGNAELLGKLRDDIDVDVLVERLGIFLECQQALDVLLRNHENVLRCLRLQVTERHDHVIFIDQFGRDLLLCNLAKDTICHLHSPPFATNGINGTKRALNAHL